MTLQVFNTMRYETFHDLFVRVGELKTKKEKIALLRENSSPTLKAILGYTYDPNVVWALPAGDPPYKVSEALDQEKRFVQESRKLYLFVKGVTQQQANITDAKREQVFITMLESLDPKDAKVLLAMKNRNLPYKGLTRKLAADAFPTISINW